MKALSLLLLPAFAVAQEEATWHIALRGGMHIHEDQAFDFVSEEAYIGASEIALDRHVWGPLWAGVAWRGGGTQDAVYGGDLSTEWSTLDLRASAMARLRPFDPIAVFGRLGPAVSWVDLDLTGGAGSLAGEDWTFGGHAGLGIEFFPLHRAFIDDMESDFGLGLSLEFTYARYAPLDLRAGTTELGTYDPSGPGWLMGLAVQW